MEFRNLRFLLRVDLFVALPVSLSLVVLSIREPYAAWMMPDIVILPS